LGAVALHPAPLHLGVRALANRSEDRVAGGCTLAVDHVLLPEEAAARLVRLVAEGALERAVRRVRPHAPFAVDEADEAPGAIRDRVQQLALALELCHPLAQRGLRLLRAPPLLACARHQPVGRSS